MNKFTQAKIHLYINQENYFELSLLLDNSNDNNRYVFEYIVNKFAKKDKAIVGFTLVKLLDCMSDEYIRRTLNYLINEPNFSNLWLNLILEREKFNNAIAEERKIYIKAFIDTLDFMDIIDLYNHKNTSDEDKVFIRECLYGKIVRVDNAYKLALAQQFKGTDIVLHYLIEKTILESNDPHYIYNLMKLKGYNNGRLINKLAEIKDKNTENKKVFIEAVAEFFPGELAKVPMGLIVSEINSSITNSDVCDELIVKVSNAVAKCQEDKQNKTVSYIDEDFVKEEPVKIREHM